MASVCIELHVFSGRSNPTWEISESHPLYSNIVQHLKKRDAGAQSQLYKGLGYRGFTAKINGLKHVIPKASEHKLERLLLSTKPPIPTSSHDNELITHVLECLPRDVLQGAVKVAARPNYEPEMWDTADVQPYNNCYNYANDMITNTFAQPGKAHGYPLPIEPITAARVSFLAKEDGLIDVPAESPDELPQTDQNLVALVIWPNKDFHWYRQDSNTLFSHKPGPMEVNNVDNNGERIPDPRRADCFPYTIFYGFMGTTKNTVVIE